MTDPTYGDETEVWFRNPHNYVREMVELGTSQMAFDRGILHRMRIDVDKWAKLHFEGRPYRALVIGDQGTAEIDQDHTLGNPVGVYPTWVYSTDTFGLLEELAAHPVGENIESYDNPELPKDERPVAGQPHRVVVVNAPSASTGHGRTFFSLLADLQRDYPECIFHVHGLYGYRIAFGMNFRSVDIDPRTNASKGKVVLPNGREVIREKLQPYLQWVHLLGWSLPDLIVPRNRCMFNMASAVWAGQYYKKNIRFKTRGREPDINIFVPGDHFPRMERYLSRRAKMGLGDKFACDSCNLADMCKFYREGAVCTVPGAETEALARMFRSRDSGQIINGLAELISIQAERLETGRSKEMAEDELDGDTTKVMRDMFAQGVQLAKLIDPSLRSGAKVNVGILTGPGSAVAVTSGAEGVAAVVRDLESRGIPRAEITPDMIKAVLEGGPARVPAAIEGHAVAKGA